MTFDVAQNVQQIFTDFLASIFGSEQQALQFVRDPQASFAEAGLDDRDLSSLNVQQAVVDACNYPGVPEHVKENLHSYTAPSYPAQQQSFETVVQQVQQVTQVVYQDNREITENNTNIEVGDNFHGDIDVDNVTADDGAVANAGDGDVNAATGDRANVLDADGAHIDGDVNVNSGDGAVQAGGDISAPVNTGTNTGIIADGDVDNAILGDGNQAAQLNDSDVDDSVINFGEGDVNQANDNHLEDAALAQGGDATNVSNNQLNNSGISTGDGDASGTFEDNDTTTTTTTQDVDTTTVTATQTGDVNVETGDGDQHDESADAVVPL